jgi:hypothetical protein
MLPPFRGHRLASLAGVVPVICLVSFLAAASSKGSAAWSSGPDERECAKVRPSNLDYLVLASFADSPQLLSMAAYHPTHRIPVPGSKPVRSMSAQSPTTGVGGVSQRRP